MIKQNVKKHYKLIGRYRMYLNRLQTYVAMVNFAMILYLYMRESPLGVEWYWWITIMSITFPIIILFDVKVMYPGTLIYAYEKNPGFQKLEKKINKIMDKLEIEDEI